MSKYYHPAYIGFDRLWKILEDIDAPTTIGYPPYNIVDLGDNKYLVEIAVAGFTEKDIEIILQENTLSISANSSEHNAKFIHRGIAARNFARRFTLADTIEVTDVTLENGMLRVYLENVIPEAKKPRRLEIQSPKAQLLVEKNVKETNVDMEKNFSRSKYEG